MNAAAAVSAVHFRPHETEDSQVIAFAEVVFAGLRLDGWRVVQGPGGLVVRPPCRMYRRPCGHCRARVEMTAAYCPKCGTKRRAEHGRVIETVKPVGDGAYWAIARAILVAWDERTRRAREERVA